MKKKASLQITLLVFLIFGLILITLFSFYSSNKKIEGKIFAFGVFNPLYSEEGNTEFYMQDIGKTALIKTYSSFARDGDYVGEVIQNSKGEFKFEKLNEKRDEFFAEKFKENFESELSKYPDEIKNKISGKYSVLVSEGKVSLKLNEYKISKTSSVFGVVYSPNVEVNFRFNDFGLISFEELYGIKDRCKDSNEKAFCFNSGIKDFNVLISEKRDSVGNKYDYVNFESKKEFLSDSGFSNIKFGFILN